MTSDKTALLAPLKPQRNRTTEVSERIAALITSGRLQPGERLPTEAELMDAMGVSRTVVREAVAALKADGLIVTRQGAGAFVASDAARMPFRIDPDSLSSIDDVIAVMELRLAIEVEAAALAAERASPSAVKSIDKALTAIDRAIAAGESAVAEDFAFHQAIAKATGNTHFISFLTFLGVHVIPRQRHDPCFPAPIWAPPHRPATTQNMSPDITTDHLRSTLIQHLQHLQPQDAT